MNEESYNYNTRLMSILSDEDNKYFISALSQIEYGLDSILFSEEGINKYETDDFIIENINIPTDKDSEYKYRVSIIDKLMYKEVTYLNFNDFQKGSPFDMEPKLNLGECIDLYSNIFAELNEIYRPEVTFGWWNNITETDSSKEIDELPLSIDTKIRYIIRDILEYIASFLSTYDDVDNDENLEN